MSIGLTCKTSPYLFERQNEDVYGGEEIVQYILEKYKIDNISEIKFLASNYDYDCYLAISDGVGYCVKYSFDLENTCLREEAFVCQFIHPFCPQFFFCDKISYGQDLVFSISSYEFAENIRDFGLSALIQNWSSFFQSYEQIKSAQCKTHFAEYIDHVTKNYALSSMPEDAQLAIQDQYQTDLLNTIQREISKEIRALIRYCDLSKNETCHGKLQPSNILFRQGYFKFIDFTQSFSGNRYLDLARLSIFLGLDMQKEKAMLNAFHKDLSNINFLSIWSEYRACYDIMIRVVFLELLFDYMKEVYIMSSSRPLKILQIIDLFSKNREQFIKLMPVLKNNQEFVESIFLEPITGKNIKNQMEDLVEESEK